MNIKDIALRLAAEKYSQLPEEIMDWLDDIIAELAKGNEPTCEWVKAEHSNYLVQRWAQDYVAKLGDKLYLIPPTISQIEQKTAEACAKFIRSNGIGFADDDEELNRIAAAVASGAWKEFKQS